MPQKRPDGIVLRMVWKM